jgi:RNA-directed DNA polymerase
MNRTELVRKLAEYLRATDAQVESILRSSPNRYKHYKIPKRTGGFRDIHQPTPELKAIQRWINSTLLSQLPVHFSVRAYETGSSIRGNAILHSKSNYFLRFDFANFFPSIHDNWVRQFLGKSILNGSLDVEFDALDTLVRAVCCRDKLNGGLALSIGAPSSPILSNRVLYALDQHLYEVADTMHIVYSRYADDLYFSSSRPNQLNLIDVILRQAMQRYTPVLSLNDQKTWRSSRKHRVAITGVIVTPTRQVSIGRSLKRRIKTEIYLWKDGRLEADNVSRLRGLVSFAMDVEPAFIVSLERKFGRDLVSTLIHSSH